MTSTARPSVLTSVWLVAAVLLIPGVAMADDCADGPNAADHPAVPRYAGACLIGSEQKSFETLTLPLGKAVRQGDVWTAEQTLSLEGAVTHLLYAAPTERTPLEVFRNYQQDLPARGYEILYVCEGPVCGRAQNMTNLLIPRRARFAAFGDRAGYAFTGNKDQDQRYLVARSADGGTHLGIYVGRNNFKSGPTNDIFGRALVYVDVIETSAMETQLIDAEGLAKALVEQGRIAVPNIYFDFGQAILKPESQPALDEIVALLSAEPALNLYVVGHTDNVGGYESNLSLSRARAEAVVAALVSRAGVDRARLVPAGVADLAPVASNATESGRAMNRRVELVAR
jgi:outer membrane protein OmpA-like peptidoglycan-associated protein